MNRSKTFCLAGSPYPGYVYLINAVGTDKFKIGKTRSPVSTRISELQTGCPFRLRYVYHAYVQNMGRTERELHRQFSPFRSVGEWFTLCSLNVQECITLMRLVQTDPSRIFTAKLIREVKLEPDRENSAERILELRAKGYGKLKIILEIWGLTRGGGAKYKAAEAEYHRVIGE